MGANETELDNKEKLKGAEGLLDLGFYEDAVPLYRELAGACPENYRVWLGIARIKTRNFTVHGCDVQAELDRAVACARTVDDYTELQETAGWYATLKPYAYAETVEREQPDVEQMERIKPIRVPISSAAEVEEARQVSRLKYLKFLLLFVVIVGLPTGFIVSCSAGKNPLGEKMALKLGIWEEKDIPDVKLSRPESSASDSAASGEEKAACPYGMPAEDVSKGMEGDNVRWVQWYLLHCGVNIAETGQYDDVTEEAVRSFQIAYGIRIDGITGIETREKLVEIYGK